MQGESKPRHGFLARQGSKGHQDRACGGTVQRPSCQAGSAAVKRGGRKAKRQQVSTEFKVSVMEQSKEDGFAVVPVSKWWDSRAEVCVSSLREQQGIAVSMSHLDLTSRVTVLALSSTM